MWIRTVMVMWYTSLLRWCWKSRIFQRQSSTSRWQQRIMVSRQHTWALVLFMKAVWTGLMNMEIRVISSFLLIWKRQCSGIRSLLMPVMQRQGHLMSACYMQAHMKTVWNLRKKISCIRRFPREEKKREKSHDIRWSRHPGYSISIPMYTIRWKDISTNFQKTG